MAELDVHDIQGMILTGYGHLKYSSYLSLRIDDAAKGRAWLAAIIPETTTAKWDTGRGGEVVQPAPAINVALSGAGLAALGLSPDVLETFPQELREGMAQPQRSRRLGDTGESAPEYWEIGGPSNDAIHVLLILQDQTADGLERLRLRQRERLAAIGGVREVGEAQEGYLPDDGREHFGYHDSISQPEVEGSPKKAAPGQERLRAGEFVLGYPNEYDKLPSPATVPAVADVHDNLREFGATAPGAERQRDLTRNGSYLVFRKLQQEVALFRKYLADNARDDAERELLSAKFVGRWKSGAPLVLAPDRDDERLAGPPRNNDFAYQESDPHGYRCPVGAHIRRANPRDSLGGDPQESIKSVNRHRLLRRGALYGEKLPEGTLEDDGRSRGVLFFCVNTDIERQFEFVQQTWFNNPKFGGLSDDRDPLLGDNKDALSAADDGPWRMTIPLLPVRRRLHDLPRFVTVRGGGYFFMPGVAALSFLASVPNPHPQRA